MYEAYYGLKDKPFSLLPDPDFLFPSRKHALALSMLEYSLAGQAGFCAITGEIGSGKSTLIRALLKRVSQGLTVGLIWNTHSSHADIAGWALSAFGKPTAQRSSTDLHHDLMMFLIEEYSAGRRCVLIVDEAQNLTLEGLEELRLLSNINADKDLLLQIILVGQPQLLEKLRRPELAQFAQRISVSYHLDPLSCHETVQYIAHRLKVAHAPRMLFNEMAVGGIYYFSGGVPRVINSICDMALVYGFAEQRTEIDLDTILRVVGDRLASGVMRFPGNGNPSDPAVVRDISAFVKEAAAAWKELPAFSPPPTPPRPLVKNGHNPAVATAARPQQERLVAPTRPEFPQRERQSWFRRTLFGSLE